MRGSVSSQILNSLSRLLLLAINLFSRSIFAAQLFFESNPKCLLEIMSDRRPTNPLFIENILLEIFEYLTVRDRNNARLVCKLWFNVGNQGRFNKLEAFHISNVKDYETVINVLSGSRRETLNLKFFRSLFDEGSLLLWRTLGQRIESLSFDSCTFHVKMIPLIFEICENLIEFALRFVEFIKNDPDYENYLDEECGLPKFASLLPREEIVREKLTTFCVKFNPFKFLELRRGQIQHFASVFPELKVLKLSMFFIDPDDDECYEWTNDFYEPHFPTFSMWIELLATKLKAIESFDIQFIPSFYRTRRLTPTDLSVFREYDLNNLKQMSLPLNRVSWHSDTNLDTIFAFKFWTSFTIACDADDRTKNLTVIAKLIEENPQLEKLHIQFSTENSSDMGVLFAALVTSNLKSLIFFLPNNPALPQHYAARVGSVLKPLPINNSVRRLEIVHFERMPEPVYDDVLVDYSYEDFQRDSYNERCAQTLAIEFCSFCLKYFRNIRYLNAQPGAASETNVIFKYQTNLKQLEMKSVRPLNLASMTVHIVESLEVLDIRPSVFDFLAAYRFPNLKCLLIHDFQIDVDCTYEDRPYEFKYGEARQIYDTEIFIEKFNCISQRIVENAPNLEFLHVMGNPFFNIEAYTVFFKSCLNFRKLRHVSMSHKFEYYPLVVSEEDVKAEMWKYMPLCPSLRTVWFETHEWAVSLVFNIIDEKFELSESHDLGLYRDRPIHGGAGLKHFYFYKR